METLADDREPDIAAARLLAAIGAPTYFKREEAERIARLNNLSDPDWSYIVAPAPIVGRFCVAVLDGEGEYVGSL